MINISSLPELSKEAIEEFTTIYKKRYEIALSFEEAKKRAQQLMALFMILFQPVR